MKIDVSKVRLAYAAYVNRLKAGWNHAESIRNTRQEFDLNQNEEDQLLSDYSADLVIEALS